MADLSFERLNIFVPFEVTGIGVFGPLKVKHHGGHATHKYRVLMSTCLGCRAVHLEILENMTTSAAIKVALVYVSFIQITEVTSGQRTVNFLKLFWIGIIVLWLSLCILEELIGSLVHLIALGLEGFGKD
jgi:hypothetical protein